MKSHTPGRAPSSETLARLIVESATDFAIFTTDLAGIVTSWNPGAEHVIGWTAEEIVGRDVRIIFTPEDREQQAPEMEMATALREGRAEDRRWHLKKDGSRFWANGLLMPLRDGELEGFVKILRDETAQRGTEEALRRSQARLVRALEVGQSGDWEMDLRTGKIEWSHNMRSLAGLPADTPATPEMLPKLIHPDDWRGVEAAMARAIEGGEPLDHSFRINGADGAVRWIRSRGLVTRDVDGRPACLVGVNFDVTPGRQTEEALRQESHRLETLNRVGAALAGELDLERLVQLVTDAAVELTGAKFGAYFHNVMDETGERLALYTLSGASRADFDRFGMPRATQIFAPTFRNEGVIRSADILADARYGQNAPHKGMPEGHLAVRSYMAVPVVSRSGNVLGGLLFGHPEPGRFEERHERLIVGIAAQAAVAIDNARLFQAVQQAKETLESRVAERTAELEHAHEQLRQSQKMEAVGQLTGGIAHDFNNLLTGVIGSLDMMQRRIAQGQTDRIERYANAALTSAHRAAALTHRLLAFARRQPLDPKPVNTNRLVTGMEELLRRTIGEAVRLEIVAAGGLWQTLCDPHQLESAILNLAINARDAMPGGGKLTIETCNAHLDNAYAARQRDVRPGQYVCICVSDTGTGMTPDVIGKAFDPFFTTKPIGQGTGLGLSMVYGFARQSEGYARIYSEVGQGSTVKLYLPRYYGEAESAGSEPAILSEAHRAEHGETVLVVEDESAVRSIVVDVLEELGYRAIEAADGPSGLKLLLSDAKVDLLITDVGLPGLNGRQLADAARAKRPGLRILFITGYAENAAIANGFLEPGMQMITKPFAIETLATRIRDMIE